MFLGVMNLINHDVLAVSSQEIQRILKAVGSQLVLLARVWQKSVGLPQARTGWEGGLVLFISMGPKRASCQGKKTSTLRG